MGGGGQFLTELVRLNDDPNARNSQQETVLHLAVLNNSVDFVRLLMRLSPRLDVNAQNMYVGESGWICPNTSHSNKST